MGLIVLAAEWLVVLVLAFAAVGKLRAPGSLRETMSSAGLPPSVVLLTAPALPVVELLVAVGLLVPATDRAASWAALGLLLAFTAFAVVVAALGLDVECTCFGDVHPTPMSWRTVARNAALSVAAVVVVVRLPVDGGPWRLPSATGRDLQWALVALVVLSALQSVWLVHLTRRVTSMQAAQDAGGPGPAAAAPVVTPGDVPLLDREGRQVTLGDRVRGGQPLVVVWLLPSCRGCRDLVPRVRVWQEQAEGRFSMVVLTDHVPVLDAVLDDPLLPPVLMQQDRAFSASVGMRRTPSAVVLTAEGEPAGEPASGSAQVRALVQDMLADGGSDQPTPERLDGENAPEVSGQVGPPADGVTVVDVDGDLSIYSPVTGRVLSLNRTASDVWLLSDGEHTADEVVYLLATSYACEAAEIREHVLGTVALFQREGLLQHEHQHVGG